MCVMSPTWGPTLLAPNCGCFKASSLGGGRRGARLHPRSRRFGLCWESGQLTTVVSVGTRDVPSLPQIRRCDLSPLPQIVPIKIRRAGRIANKKPRPRKGPWSVLPFWYGGQPKFFRIRTSGCSARSRNVPALRTAGQTSWQRPAPKSADLCRTGCSRRT